MRNFDERAFPSVVMNDSQGLFETVAQFVWQKVNLNVLNNLRAVFEIFLDYAAAVRPAAKKICELQR